MGGVITGLSSGSVTTGALSAGAAEASHNFLKDLPSDAQVIGSAVIGAVAAAASGGEVASGGAIAAEGTIHNYLSHWQEREREKDLEACDGALCRLKISTYWELINAQQDAGVVIGSGAGIGVVAWDTAEGIVQVALHPADTVNGIRALLNDSDVRAAVGAEILAGYEERLNRLSQAREDAGWDGAITNGIEGGRLAADIVGTITAVQGAAKAIAKLPAATRSTLALLQSVPKAVSTATPLKLSEQVGPTFLKFQPVTNVFRNDGALGEFLTKDILGEVTGLDFKSIQNASGHGIDAVAINAATKTIVHVEVKTSTIGKFGGVGDLASRFKAWRMEAGRSGTITGQQLPADMAAYARTVQGLIDDGYKVEHYISKVSIPKVGQSGVPVATLAPWKN